MGCTQNKYLNVERVRRALSLLCGWHDFSLFGGKKSTDGGRSGLRCVMETSLVNVRSFLLLLLLLLLLWLLLLLLLLLWLWLLWLLLLCEGVWTKN